MPSENLVKNLAAGFLEVAFYYRDARAAVLHCCGKIPSLHGGHLTGSSAFHFRLQCKCVLRQGLKSCGLHCCGRAVDLYCL